MTVAVPEISERIQRQREEREGTEGGSANLHPRFKSGRRLQFSLLCELRHHGLCQLRHHSSGCFPVSTTGPPD
jgi:hypothetical protein